MIGYKYLIIGGGMSAAAAIRGIRDIDPSGSIGLISEEVHAPYKRPPLSKKLWQGKPVETVWKGMSADGADMHLGHTVQSINPGERCVVDETGTTYTYEKLLLATGGTPRRLPFGGDDIIYFRTLDDYKRLRPSRTPKALRRDRRWLHRCRNSGCPGDERQHVTMILPRRASANDLPGSTWLTT